MRLPFYALVGQETWTKHPLIPIIEDDICDSIRYSLEKNWLWKT